MRTEESLFFENCREKVRPQASEYKAVRSGTDSSCTLVAFAVKVFVQTGNDYFFLG